MRLFRRRGRFPALQALPIETPEPEFVMIRVRRREEVAQAQREASAHFARMLETVAPERVHTYDEGAALGCPDCATGIEHCCPFLWASELPEPQRTHWLRHARAHLADVYENGGDRA